MLDRAIMMNGVPMTAHNPCARCPDFQPDPNAEGEEQLEIFGNHPLFRHAIVR